MVPENSALSATVFFLTMSGWDLIILFKSFIEESPSSFVSIYLIKSDKPYNLKLIVYTLSVFVQISL